MTPAKIERLMRSAASSAEASSDLIDNEEFGEDIFHGAVVIKANAFVMSHASVLLDCLERVIQDYEEKYNVLTNGRREPHSAAYRSAVRLVKKLKSNEISGRED